jgi:SAM-dependent methyltransferase
VHDASWVRDARDSYDRVAVRYDDVTRGVLDGLPFERAMVDLFAQRVLAAGGGPVLDAGCGPGWITGHLARRGVDVCGLDVSPALIDIARTNEPDLRFCVGSITELPIEADSLAGLVCWYVLHHVPDDAVAGVLAEFARALAPGGQLLTGGHIGAGSSYLKTDGYGGIPMRVMVNRRSNDSMAGLLRDAGFTVDAEVALGKDETSRTGIIFAIRSSGKGRPA